MATSYYKLDIESRESVGKKSTKAIRREGKIPSTLYFKGEEPESVAKDKIKLYQENRKHLILVSLTVRNRSYILLLYFLFSN